MFVSKDRTLLDILLELCRSWSIANLEKFGGTRLQIFQLIYKPNKYLSSLTDRVSQRIHFLSGSERIFESLYHHATTMFYSLR